VGRTVDWRALADAALAHGTAPFLFHHLLAVAPDALPRDLAEAATAYCDTVREASGAAAAELLALRDALERADVPVLPFKGPALACQAYGAAVAPLRVSRDLDLLIGAGDIDRCMAVLAGLGYRSPAADLRSWQLAAYRAHNGQDILFADDGKRLPVEPHWEFAPRSFGARLGAEGIWSRAVSVRLGRRGTVRTLSAEDALLVAGLHGAKEQWARLVWVADVAELLRRHGDGLDWDRALDLARGAGIRRMVLLGVALADALLGAVPLPPEVRGVVAADRACRDLVGEVRARLLRGAGARAELSVFRPSRFIWRAHDGLAGRLRYLAGTLTAVRPHHFRMLHLPAPVSFAYPAVKVAHDYLALPVWRAGKAVVRTARRRRQGPGPTSTAGDEAAQRPPGPRAAGRRTG
jgi:hypothetical protein